MNNNRKFEVSGAWTMQVESKDARQAKEDAQKVLAYVASLAGVKFSSYAMDVKPANSDNHVAGRW